MRNTITTSTLCFLTMIIPMLGMAYENHFFNKSYQIETTTLTSEYKNILGENVQTELDDFFNQSNTSTSENLFTIKIKFLKGLETLQRTQKTIDGKMFYKVRYLTPSYKATVFDATGNEINLKNEYGGEEMVIEFGKDLETSDENKLFKDWLLKKEMFFKTKELDHNNVNAFIKELQKTKIYTEWLEQGKTDSKTNVVDEKTNTTESETSTPEEVTQVTSSNSTTAVDETKKPDTDVKPIQDNSGIKLGINENNLGGAIINKLKGKLKRKKKPTTVVPQPSIRPNQNATIVPPATSSVTTTTKATAPSNNTNTTTTSAIESTATTSATAEIIIPKTSSMDIDAIPVPAFKTVTVPMFTNDKSNTNPEVDLVPKTISSKFYMGLSSEPLKFEEGMITGWIRDESDVGDFLTLDEKIDATKRAIGFHVGFGSAGSSKKVWDVDFSFTFNSEARVLLGNIGYGVQFGTSKFSVTPMARFGVGNGSFKIGEFERTNPESEYIQIGEEKRLYHDKVSVRLREVFAYVGPELNIAFPINRTSGIQLSGMYRVAVNIAPQLKFKGIGSVDNEESSNKAKRELGDELNNIRFNNIRQDNESNLLQFGGLAFRASYVTYF